MTNTTDTKATDVTNADLIKGRFMADYNAATGAAKVRVRNEAMTAMMKAVSDGDLDRAMTIKVAIDAMAPEAVVKVNRRPVAIADRIATMEAAIKALRADDDFDADLAGTPDDKAVAKFATVSGGPKARGTLGAPGTFVADAIAILGTGTHTIADMIKSGADYTGAPGNLTGRIGAYLDRVADDVTDTDDGHTFTVGTNDKGVRAVIVTA